MFQQNPTFTRAMKMTQGAMMENDSNCTSLPSVSRVDQRSLVTSLLVHPDVLLLSGNGQNCLHIPIPSTATPKKMHIPKGKKSHLRTSIELQKGRKAKKKKNTFLQLIFVRLRDFFHTCPGRKARIEPTKSVMLWFRCWFSFSFRGSRMFQVSRPRRFPPNAGSLEAIDSGKGFSASPFPRLENEGYKGWTWGVQSQISAVRGSGLIFWPLAFLKKSVKRQVCCFF